MDQERRQSSMESILLALGEVKHISGNTVEKLDRLNEKVAFQNGRIGAIEMREAEKKGYFRAMSILVWVLTAIIIPMALIVFQVWVRNQ